MANPGSLCKLAGITTISLKSTISVLPQSIKNICKDLKKILHHGPCRRHQCEMIAATHITIVLVHRSQLFTDSYSAHWKIWKKQQNHTDRKVIILLTYFGENVIFVVFWQFHAKISTVVGISFSNIRPTFFIFFYLRVKRLIRLRYILKNEIKINRIRVSQIARDQSLVWNRRNPIQPRRCRTTAVLSAPHINPLPTVKLQHPLQKSWLGNQ